MPIYEYGCTACGHEFEELVFSGDAAPKCPKCNDSDVQRLLSRFAFKTSEGFTSSTGSSCTGCSATSCTGCSTK